jgi:hypothetical protein
MLLLDTEIERSPEVSSTGWEYRIGYRVVPNRTNKKGLCLRLQGFIRVERIAPGMVHSAADPILAFYRRDGEEDTGTDKKVLCGLCVWAVELGFLGEEHEIIDQ